MFQRKPRRFRHRSNGRGRPHRGNGQEQMRLRSNSFSNSQTRNNFRTALSPEKLLEKYNMLAKEAMSSGDITLSENYLQHADHFMRIIEDRNRNRMQNKTNMVEKSFDGNKTVSENVNFQQAENIKDKDKDKD